MVKDFTKAQVDDLIRLKFGRLVSTPYHTQYASNATLGKIFGVSGRKVWQLYMQRFQEIKDRELPFLQQFEKQMQRYKRKRWGLRFLKSHEKDWLVIAKTLHQ